MARLKAAPVFFTVAQMRFNPLLEMTPVLPALQDEFRKFGYPDYRVSKAQSFEFQQEESGITVSPKNVVRYTFRNKQRTAAFLLDPAALTFELTDYPVFEGFSDTFFAALDIVHKHRPIEYWDRLGMRMLDAIQPRKGEQLLHYVKPEALGFGGLIGNGVEHQHTITESLLRSGPHTLLVRTMRSSEGISVPHDLAPLNVSISQRFAEYEGETVIMDTDCFVEQRSDFGAEASKELKELKGWLSRSFKAIVTEHALKVWE